MYWYDKSPESITDAIEKFIKLRGYSPSIVVVREDTYSGSFARAVNRALKKRGLRVIEIGYSHTVTPYHFHLYPFVDKRVPKRQIDRRPLL